VTNLDLETSYPAVIVDSVYLGIYNKNDGTVP